MDSFFSVETGKIKHVISFFKPLKPTLFDIKLESQTGAMVKQKAGVSNGCNGQAMCIKDTHFR